MKKLKNEDGVALVTSLLLTLLALAFIMALLYMVTWQTKLSAAHKRYKTAIEASQGGAEIFAKKVIPYIFNNNTTAGLAGQLPGVNLVAGSSLCLKAKINNPTSLWGGACTPNSLTTDPTQNPDVRFTLQGSLGAQSNFTVYTKIVDSVPGNSDLSGYELLDSGAGVTGISSGVAPKHIPALYRIEVQGQKELNPQEKAQLSILYAY
jgi:hypothetical protein